VVVLEILNHAVEAITDFEGQVPHMYLDTKSNVTVGIGQLLATRTAAQALPFRMRADGKPASASAIAGEYDAIQAISPRGARNDLGFAHFRELTTLDLPEADCRALLTARLIGEFYPQLRIAYPGFDEFPAPAQEALFDMIYNLGATGLAEKFPTFSREMRSRDWRDAARQCHRIGLADARNDYVRDRLLAAAADSATVA
jgi:GH24 family phage-related lysozyme (muramidase)